MLYAPCLNLDQSKILSSGNGLNLNASTHLHCVLTTTWPLKFFQVSSQFLCNLRFIMLPKRSAYSDNRGLMTSICKVYLNMSMPFVVQTDVFHHN